MFKSPFSPGFWKEAAATPRRLRVLVLCALYMAASIILGYCYIPISENLTIRFTYLATATAALVAGPVGGLIYGFTVDILDFFMHPGYSFFFGYTLSAMAGALVYALFFFRQKITIVRIVLCRLIINYGVNVLLGSLWSSMLYSKGYIFYMGRSLVKNTLMLPIEVIVMTAFFSLLLPALRRSSMLPADQCRKVTWF